MDNKSIQDKDVLKAILIYKKLEENNYVSKN